MNHLFLFLCLFFLFCAYHICEHEKKSDFNIELMIWCFVLALLCWGFEYVLQNQI